MRNSLTEKMSYGSDGKITGGLARVRILQVGTCRRAQSGAPKSAYFCKCPGNEHGQWSFSVSLEQGTFMAWPADVRMQWAVMGHRVYDSVHDIVPGGAIQAIIGCVNINFAHVVTVKLLT